MPIPGMQLLVWGLVVLLWSVAIVAFLAGYAIGRGDRKRKTPPPDPLTSTKNL